MYEEETVGEEGTVTGATMTPPRPSSSQAELEDTSTLESPSLAQAYITPRAPNSGGKEPEYADFSSPYENLRTELVGTRTPKLQPTTPGKTQALRDMGLFNSSPFVPPTSGKRAPIDQGPLLHRILDKTYRVQAAPQISPRKYKPTAAYTPRTSRRGATTPKSAKALPDWADSSPLDTPAPQLRFGIFSPMKTPRTLGVSAQTPGQGKQPFSVTKTGVFDSDSDVDGDDLGFSPPKTIQFHIPQSKLLQTLAREASKRIVEDLFTAGGDITETDDG